MREVLHKIDPDAFITQLAQAKLAITLNGLKRVLHTFIKLQHLIGNTLKYKHLMNGYIKGLNNKITVLKRIAYDYRNFQKFRKSYN